MRCVKTLGLILVWMLLLSSIPIYTAYAQTEEKVRIITGSTEDFGGGDYIEMEYKDASIGVIYGNAKNENHLIIYSKGKNSFKEVEKTVNGRLLQKRIFNAEILTYEEISRVMEFRDINNNSRFDAITTRDDNYILTSIDYPVFGHEIKKFSVSKPIIKRNSDRDADIYISFSIINPNKNMAWNDIMGKLLPIEGGKIADFITINLNISMKISNDRISIPRYRNTAEKAEIFSENGETIYVSAEYSISINGWGFEYDDSKLFVEKRRGVLLRYLDEENPAIYANITTSSPTYLHLNGSFNLSKSKPAYGHSIRVHMGDTRIGEFVGYSNSIVNGENASYILMISGNFPENLSCFERDYHGFSLGSTENYIQGNISCGEKISFKYSFISDFEFVEASPWWIYIMPFEVALISFFSIFLHRKNRSNT